MKACNHQFIEVYNGVTSEEHNSQQVTKLEECYVPLIGLVSQDLKSQDQGLEPQD